MSETATEVEQKTAQTMCEATRPDTLDGVTDDEFREMPIEVQKKILADLRAWKAMGCEP